MKKLLCLLLSLATLLSLTACVSDDTKNDHDSEEAEYTLEDVLITQAVEIARLTGLRADTDYQAAIGMTEDLIDVAATFTVLAESDPEEAMIGPVPDNIVTELNYANALLGDIHLAAASTLYYSTVMELPEELESDTAVLLNYGSDCSVLVVFTPLDDEITGAAAYPLYSEVSSQILDEYFDDAEELDEDAIEDACDRAKDVSCEADPSRETPTAQYYTDLALMVMDSVGDIDEDNVAEFAGDPQVIDLAICFVREICVEPVQVGVFTFTDGGDTMFQAMGAADALALRDPELAALARQQMFSALPSIFTNAYDISVSGIEITANSIVRALAEPVVLGAVPDGMDSPVLVMMRYSNSLTVMVCIYDSGYGLYQYSYSFLPHPFNWDESMENAGLEALE